MTQYTNDDDNADPELEPNSVIFDAETTLLFQGTDIRERAEAQRVRLLPKLGELLDVTELMIVDAFGLEPTMDSTRTERPAFRKDAIQIKDLRTVYLGYAPRRNNTPKGYLKPNGKVARLGYFRLIYHLFPDGMVAMLQVERLPEAKMLWSILRTEVDAVVDYLERHDLRLWTAPDTFTGHNIRDNLLHTILPDTGHWWENGIEGEPLSFPIDEDQSLSAIGNFSALFPMYQSMIDMFFGRKIRLFDYMRMYEDHISKFDDEQEDLVSMEQPRPLPVVLSSRESDRPQTPSIGSTQESFELGLRGELTVLKAECHRLISAGRIDLAERIVHVSVIEGDGAGYDIRSYDLDGSEIWIEVKTTNGGEATPFFITRNELKCSEREPDRFQLHRIFNYSGDRRTYVLKGSLRSHCRLEPTEYRATLSNSQDPESQALLGSPDR